MNVHLLGTFHVESDGEPVDIATRASQLLLARLAMDPGQPKPRARLAGLLWPESEESQARSNLRHALWRLKQSLGEDFLEAKKETIALSDQDTLHIDVREFVDSAGGIESPESLIASLEHYGGELLPGFYEDWVVRERERLTASYERRMGRLLNLLLEEGRYAEMKRRAERWIARGGAPEPAYRGLMKACAGLGDQVGMVEAYERCVEELEDELGVAPSADTVALFERLGAGERPPGAPTELPKHNLPSPISSFIGRERELDEVADLLADSDLRLLTFTGPPGVGKTRLALEAAWRQVEDYEGGVWWIELAPVEAAERVADAIARSIGLEGLPGDPADRVKRLATSLDRGPLLLVIDNCEHLLDRVAPLTEELLQLCRQLTVLTTSRRDLSIPGEAVWAVPTLLVEAEPVGGNIGDVGSAVELFAERARQASRGFEVTAENLPSVIKICRRLDGVALAIELAAARMKSLTARDLLSQVDRRFDLLRRESTAGDPKQRTLEASLRWSLELLPEEDREVFLRLSVFRGGFHLELAHEVCSGLGITPVDIEASVARLVEHSLVTTQRTDEGRIRYGLLETMRQFGEAELERRGILSDAYELHIEAMKSLCARWGPKFNGPDDALYLRRMDLELENLSAAVDRSIERGDARAAADLIAPIHRYVFFRRNSWGIAEKAVTYALEHEESIRREDLLWILCTAGSIVGDYPRTSQVDSALEHYERALEVALAIEDGSGIVESSGWLERFHFEAGHDEKAHEFASLCEETAEREGTPTLLVKAARFSSFLKPVLERFESLRKAHELAEENCAVSTRGLVEVHLGVTLALTGYYQEAIDCYQSVLELVERTGEARWHDLVLENIQFCQTELGKYQESLNSLDQAEEAARRIRGEQTSTPFRKVQRARVLAYSGDIEVARALAFNLELGKPKNELGRIDIRAFILRALVLCKVGELSQADAIMMELSGEVGDHRRLKEIFEAWGMAVWADVDHRRERLGDSLSKYRDAFSALGDRMGFRWKHEPLVNFAYLLVDMDRHDTSAFILRRTDCLREAAGIPVHPIDHERRNRYFSEINEALGEDWLTAQPVDCDLEEIDLFISEAAELAQRLSV